MIASFADKRLEAYWKNRVIKGFPPEILAVLQRKLLHLEHVDDLQYLRTPPANRLELLKGKLAGLHSIRVNRQWRLVFRWENGAAHDVRLMDYH